MTTEQKAKAYDEALKDMMVIYPNLKGDAKLAVEHAFTQLRESEEEKMMRVIGLALTDVPEERFTSLGTTLKDCLAYLEKQKEPTKEELYAEAGTTEKEYIANTMKMVRAMREKQKDHFRDDTKMVEQKPTKDKYQQELEATDRWQEGYEAGYNAASKPAEWSEEDLNMLWNIISIVGESKSIQADEMLDWLKSLRPSWKPSEEQMRAMKLFVEKHRHTANTLIGGWPSFDAFESLYNDIKKLM